MERISFYITPHCIIPVSLISRRFLAFLFLYLYRYIPKRKRHKNAKKPANNDIKIFFQKIQIENQAKNPNQKSGV